MISPISAAAREQKIPTNQYSYRNSFTSGIQTIVRSRSHNKMGAHLYVIPYKIDCRLDSSACSKVRIFAIAFPILDFLTIPILTQSLILETTPLNLTPTLSTLTTL
ncbi:hypothetical protein [Moorena sp. SIO3B2]|uniref:hypothetical protein n=2 Tax=Moorena TaxID=1155738 RepID=UPI002581036F|nr:hypothetical protein [Moorena sp. SIO3B2]